MPAIWKHKADTTERIATRITLYLEQHPEQARNIALAALKRLARKMTLKELLEWQLQLEHMIE